MTVVIDLLPGTAPSPLPTLPSLRIAPIRPGDREGIHRLFAACSPQTVRNRFRAPLHTFPASYLDALLAGPESVNDTLAARHGVDGELVGLGSIALTHAGGPDVAEIGLLVPDAWQRQGLGRSLSIALVERARRRGVTRLVADVPHGRGELLNALGRELTPIRRTAHRDGLTGVFRIPASIGLRP